eukprot:366265-Chlamydomonas_euryale.AAC.6
MVRMGMVRMDMVRMGMVRMGMVRMDMVNVDMVRMGMVRMDMVHVDMVRMGMVRMDMVRNGQGAHGHGAHRHVVQWKWYLIAPLKALLSFRKCGLRTRIHPHLSLAAGLEHLTSSARELLPFLNPCQLRFPSQD